MTTQAQIDALDFDHAARELAHGRVAPCTPDTYAAAYLEALAEVLGVRSAEQCAEGEAWEPADFLGGDFEALRGAAGALGVTLDARPLFRLYASPSEEARREVVSHL